MKLKLLFIFVFSSTLIFTQNSAEVVDFGTNPGNLSLFYYTPKNPKPNMPMVAVLHGCSQTAKSVAELTGWNALADEYGFYVMYPQQHFPNNPSHCFNWFKNNEIERDKGECESISQMVNYMRKKFTIDSSRIFITGLSAGAAMSVVMISVRPAMFKAAAILAGGPYKPGTNIFTSSGSMVWGVNKTPEQWKDLVWRQNPAFKANYPKVIIYHGDKDPVVNPRSAAEIVKQWTALHKTDTIPDIIDSNYLFTRDVRRLVYKSQDNSDAVIYYKIADMGHAVPVDPGYCKNQGGHNALFASDKKFYSTYYIACDFGLIPDWYVNGPVKVKTSQASIFWSGSEAKKDYNYEWKLPEGCEIIGQKNSNSVSVRWGKKPGRVSLQETAPDGCRYHHAALHVEIEN
jgi:poly(hydroxyalkanoate) depolymerase family esterase